MTLFSRMRGNEEGDALKAAVLCPALMTALADGEHDLNEADKLLSIVRFSPIFAGDSPQDLKRIVDTVMEAWRGAGTGAAIAEVKATLSPGLRETAIAFAMRIAAADDDVDGREADAIVSMAQTLEVPEATYDKMAEVVAIMQRGPRD